MSIPMTLYLPIAGNSVNILAVLGLGGGVGLLSGIFGVGGGFLMTPLLMMMGIPPTVAAASDSNQIVGASTSGTLIHLRLGNVDVRHRVCAVAFRKQRLRRGDALTAFGNCPAAARHIDPF